MPFLIPLALTLLSTGYGIYQGVKANDALAQQGAASVDAELFASRAAFLNDDAAYRQAKIDLADAQAKADKEAEQAVKTATLTLYGIGILVIGLLIAMLMWPPSKTQEVK